MWERDYPCNFSVVCAQVQPDVPTSKDEKASSLSEQLYCYESHVWPIEIDIPLRGFWDNE